ncbi:hypothetical protein [Falsirhodobacter sp. 20TX0035]|uniref:hypothetical protein n=1 Tax=Falsirhodobacter sp. 20TX0035 TaxID=3022019 RepID=UPI0023310756|nr:hypothetical protein [Falsirhodobacter sp. 20TX0035]MDB6453180.1 hypothetical protein [Falsirhodobacter sp. 20TX0035]
MRSLVPGTRPPFAGTQETCLIIETPEAFRYLDRFPARPSIVMARFRDIGTPLIERVQPDWVICPLVATGFDALDVLSRLGDTGRTLRVGVLSQALPNRRMVERELQSHAGGLEVSLLTL